jgi:hypothetical protein
MDWILMKENFHNFVVKIFLFKVSLRNLINAPNWFTL